MRPNLQLKRERELRGWSQAKVAQEIGTSAKIVSRWERGTSLPSPHFREKLCKLFDKDALALGVLLQDEEALQEPNSMPKITLPFPISAVEPSEIITNRSVVPMLGGANNEAAIAPLAIIDHSNKLPSFLRPRMQRSILLAGLLLLTLIAFLATLIRGGFTVSPGSDTIATNTIAIQNEHRLEAQAFQQYGIGISDGLYAFDTFPGRLDTEVKKQAADALQHSQQSQAINLLTQAITLDPTDGEAQIYNENLHLWQDGSPTISIVLGLPINGNSADLTFSRADMQAAFLAQHKINKEGLLPSGYKLRILIDNCGANNGDVAQVTGFIKARVQAGNPDHIIAVVGWPTSEQTLDAYSILTAAQLPLISQTASSPQLSGSSPYFFRVNSSNVQEGTNMGTVAVNILHARKILVLRDENDAYSSTLADAFTRSVTAQNALAINDPHDSFTQKMTTVSQYETIVKDAVSNNVDLIFLPGLDVDAIRLAHAVGNVERASGNSTLTRLAILGGDALDTSQLLGRGSGPDAALARQFPQDMQRLHFSSFGHYNEWAFLHIPPGEQPAFFQDWQQTYQSSPSPEENAPQPESDAMLTYDAVQVVIHAASLVNGQLTGPAVRDALASLGSGNVAAYQGVSGLLRFNEAGDPIDKATVILAVTEQNGHNEITLSQVVGTFR